MKVLGIDPGYDRLGIAVVCKKDGKENVDFSSCIQTKKTLNFTERLSYLGKELKSIIEEYQPDVLAIETLFFNKNIKTALLVAHARGVVLYLANEYNMPLYEYGPQEIKVAVTGYGKSDKKAVMSMVPKLVSNFPDQAFDDEYDAIAVAVTHLAHSHTSV